LRISRAKAIPRYNPDYPCIAFPNAVSVVVVPHTRGGQEPAPGDEFLRTVLNHLDRHRLITADVHVIKPEYIKICVKCKVKVLKKSSQDLVVERIKKNLAEFFDPIKGGEEGKGWPFGRFVYPSEIYQKIDNVDGVDYTTNVLISSFARNYCILYQKDVIRIPKFGLVFSGEHEIEFI
jgi:predicted phage baseplate assembly protein